MDAVNELLHINFSYVMTSVFITLIGIKAIVSIFEWCIDKLGLETKWMRQKKEEHELIIQTSQNLALLQKKHMEDMKKSDDHDTEMKDDIKKLSRGKTDYSKILKYYKRKLVDYGIMRQIKNSYISKGKYIKIKEVA